MSIEIAMINNALVVNYTHKFLKTNDIFKVLQIVGVVEKKTLRQHGRGIRTINMGKIVVG